MTAAMTTVEPMIKPQWFVKMDEMAKAAIEALDERRSEICSGTFWIKPIFTGWRTSVTGVFPVSCGGDTESRLITVMSAARLLLQEKCQRICPKCGCTHFHQDEDTLDTWFSSALWPFSTLGWPDKTPELEYFYPTDVLVTGYDIIFFWVIRMVFSGIEQTGKCTVPSLY